jgi:hypothetical protein
MNAARSKGQSLIELAIILPIFILLSLAAFEYGLAVYENNVVVGLAREGANLAARSSSFTDPVDMLNALAESADPLDVDHNAAMYLTRLIGLDDGSAEVVEQYRLAPGSYVPTSKVWSGCTHWNSGVCSVPSHPHPSISLAVSLTEGEEVFAMEVYYLHPALFTNIISEDTPLYSMSIM